MKRKHTFWNFVEYEMDAFAEYLEMMAAKGWYLKKMKRGGGLHFIKGEPRSLKFCAAVIPESSEFDSSERTEVQMFREYCEEAGWHFQCGNHIWQVFYTEEEQPLPIETDPRLKIEAEKAVSLSPGRLIATGVLLLLFLIPMRLLWSDPVAFLSSRERMMSETLIFLSGLILVYYPLSAWLWYRRAERGLKRGEKLPETSFDTVKKRGIIDSMYTLIFIVVLCSQGDSSNYVIEVFGVMIAVGIGRFILSLVSERDGGSREQKAITYIVSTFIVVFLFLGLYHIAADRFLQDKARKEPVSLAEADYGVYLEKLGYNVSDVYLNVDRRTSLASYQSAYGYCITPEENEVWFSMEYYDCRFTGALKKTLNSQYPKDHGNAWKTEKVSEIYADGVTLVKYEYKRNFTEFGELEDDRDQTLYVAYTEKKILSFSFESQSVKEEKDLMKEMKAALTSGR